MGIEHHHRDGNNAVATGTLRPSPGSSSATRKGTSKTSTPRPHTSSTPRDRCRVQMSWACSGSVTGAKSHSVVAENVQRVALCPEQSVALIQSMTTS